MNRFFFEAYAGSPRGGRVFADAPSPRSTALPLAALLAIVITAPATAEAADAATQVQTQTSYDIPAGGLDQVLKRFAGQAHVTLSVDARLTEGKSSPGLRGNYTVDQGFAALLAGTGLQTVADDGGYVVTESPAAATGAASGKMLGKIEVQASDNDGASSDSYASNELAIGGKTARDPREIQQSVSVVTQQRIQDQNLTDVAAALNETTGITLTMSDINGSSIYSRGFQVNSLQFDGGSPAVFSNYGTDINVPDLAAYDHVEVLRGSDGLFAGAGEGGGTVNLVRKRPLDTSQVLFDLSAGSWDQYRGQLDATGPVALDGRVRGRVVAAYSDNQFFYDIAKDEQTVLYGVLEGDLTDSTLLTVGATYERGRKTATFYGLPRYSTGANLDLSRSTCLCTDWSHRNYETPEVFAKLEQSFGSGWTLKLNLSQRRTDWDYKYAWVSGAIDPTTLTGTYLSGSKYEYEPRQRLADVTVNGDFEALGIDHEVLVGANWQDVNADGAVYTELYGSRPVVDIFNFDPAAPEFADPGVPADPTRYWIKNNSQQNGIYTSLRSSLTSQLHSIVGLRYSNYRSSWIREEYDGGALDERLDLSYRESDVFTPYGGLTYDLTPTLSLYASYSEIFKPQGNYITESGDHLEPITGATYEIGAKGSWLNGTLNASLSTYQVRRQNAPVRTDASGSFGDYACCYVAAAEIRSQGIDAELTGQLLPGWQVFAGYTYNTNKYESGYGEDDGSSFMPQTPKHQLKLWTMAQLPGNLSAWRFGGGVNAQTRNYQSGTAAILDEFGDEVGSIPYRYTEGAYAIVALRGEYRVDSRWLVALNVNNVFDRTYYQTVSSSSGGNYYGEPRNFRVSMQMRW